MHKKRTQLVTCSTLLTLSRFTDEWMTDPSQESLTDQSTPLHFLKSFITENVIQGLLLQTNKYANEIKATKPNALPNWTPVNVNEIWVFFALELLMGIVKKPSLKDYWSTDPLLHTPIFSNQISRNRYQYILRSLHFADNSAPNPSDKLWKLGVFLPEIQKQFEIRVNLGKFLCIDESLMPFHGRLGFRQYHPLKRADQILFPC